MFQALHCTLHIGDASALHSGLGPECERWPRIVFATATSWRWWRWCCTLSRYVAYVEIYALFWGDQRDPKYACGGPNSILRTGVAVAVVLYFIPSSTSTRCGAGGSGGRAALLGSCALASCRLDSPADVRCRGTLPQGANNGRFMADIIPRCSLCSTIPDLRPVPLWGSSSVQK